MSVIDKPTNMQRLSFNIQLITRLANVTASAVVDQY
jgi:hypothetical protein